MPFKDPIRARDYRQEYSVKKRGARAYPRCVICGVHIFYRANNAIYCERCAKMIAKDRHSLCVSRYQKTPKGIEAEKKARKNRKITGYEAKYYHTEKGKIAYKKALKKYRKTPAGKIVSAVNHSKRRSYGYNMLNVYFLGSHGHHINDIDVVFIPGDIHVRFNNINKNTHRKNVLNYYGSLENMLVNKLLVRD